MLHRLEPEKALIIIKNLLDACRDITSLTQEGYRLIHLRTGFIAHYDREGFIEEYLTSQNLRDKILANQIHNTSCNRSLKDKDNPYYLQQGEIEEQDHVTAGGTIISNVDDDSIIYVEEPWWK